MHNYQPGEGSALMPFSHLKKLKIVLREADYTSEPQQIYLILLHSIVRINPSGFYGVFG
jgi:hypothetical protein